MALWEKTPRRSVSQRAFLLRVMNSKSQSITDALSITRGVQAVPMRGCLYGPSGVGKSTFAKEAPNPLFLDFEKGSHHLEVDRIEPCDWDHVQTILKSLRNDKHEYQTLIIDTADWAEKLLSAWVCQKHNKDSIEDFGYGKGWTILGEYFSEFLSMLDGLRTRGMHVLFVAHSQIRKFEQPDQSGSYDRYELKLSKQCAPLLKEWCDMLLFCSYETKVVELDGKKKAVGGRERVLYTCHTAAWDAKNRHGFSEKLPFAFSSIASAFKKAAAKTEKAQSPAPVAPKADTGSILTQQLENIQTLWKQLSYGQNEMTKLFQWLEAESLEGAENWSDLNQEQASRAIGFLSKKASGKGGVM